MGTIHDRISRGAKTEQGAIAIILAISMVGLLIVAGMVLDFGLARLDRQANKSAADAAVAAGIRGFDQDDGNVYAFRGVCDAITFLQVKPELSSLPKPAYCTEVPVSAKLGKVCNETVPDSLPPTYTSPLTNGYTVTIAAPYTLPDPNFPEDYLASMSGDNASPCDNLAVIITQARKPGLGSLAGASQLTTTIRSVGRVAVGAGDQAPALILLERSKCSVLTVGSAGAGAESKIRVYGTTVGATTMSGSIHSDSTATGADCGTSQQLFQGKQADGIVAYGATGGKSGVITSVATANGVDLGVVIDSSTNIYGTTALNELSAGTKSVPAVSGRKQVSRKPIDDRYASGVRSALIAANASPAAGGVWLLTSTNPQNGWTRVDCSPTATQLAAVTALTKLYIDCPSFVLGTPSAPVTLLASKIFFNGFIKGGNLLMPNATNVYVNNTDSSGNPVFSSGISLGRNEGFCIRSTYCTETTAPGERCTSAPTSNKAQLLIRQGQIKQGGGILRMCNTTVILLSGQTGTVVGQPGGCVPIANGAAPTSTPCATGTGIGNGQITTTGGSMDWTAPNKYASMPSSSFTQAQRQVEWDGGEDLALWTESGGSGGSTFSMAGGANMNVKGVFMAPNASPFGLGGGGTLDLTDAQYIVTSFSVSGGSTLLMKVDPNNVVTFPTLDPFTLVR